MPDHPNQFENHDNPCADVPPEPLSPVGRVTREQWAEFFRSLQRSAVVDYPKVNYLDLRPQRVTTHKPDAPLFDLGLFSWGVFPPFGMSHERTISCQACGRRLIWHSTDFACEDVNCRYGHGWIAARLAEQEVRWPEELVDGEWTD